MSKNTTKQLPVGKNFQEALKQSVWLQLDIAKELNIAATNLSTWKKTGVPKRHVVTVANLLHVPVARIRHTRKQYKPKVNLQSAKRNEIQKAANLMQWMSENDPKPSGDKNLSGFVMANKPQPLITQPTDTCARIQLLTIIADNRLTANMTNTILSLTTTLLHMHEQ